MVFIIKSFWTIVFIFIVISITFRPICPPAFFRCLSNSGTFMELRTTSFIESSDPREFNIIPQKFTLNCLAGHMALNGHKRWFPELLRRQSSEGCRFSPHYRRVTNLMVSIKDVVQSSVKLWK